MKTGPPIEHLMRRLAETPAEFLAEPRVTTGGTVQVEAVVYDIIADLGHVLSAQWVGRFASRAPGERNWLRLVLLGAWLLHDETLQDVNAEDAVRWLADDLAELAKLVEADQFVSNQDRREELSRILLATFDLTPAGETPEQAADRLSTVDSLERARILAETKAKRERADQIRREMEEQRAREAAARYSRE